MVNKIINDLRTAYDNSAAKRDQTEKKAWKLNERQNFLELLQQEDKTTLLELGAGPGDDGRFFQNNGLTVTCTDLSPAMVKLCRAKGLDARVMDFRNLNFGDGRFDAIYALNSLLHLPKTDLPTVLHSIQRILKPGGLFFMGVYGGIDQAAIWQDDDHTPKRFFTFYTDKRIQQITAQFFTIHQFTTIQVGTTGSDPHFQQLILRRP